MTLPLLNDAKRTPEHVAAERGRSLWPTSAYTVGLLLLNLAALSLAFFDAKGLVVLILSLMYTAHLRLLLTSRAEQRRTNELLEEWLDPVPALPQEERPCRT
ncbi:hypothetical protein [Deinococcus humi]|uniref:Uncharacterized protein n=1 Tax=Deinococcus humi TaxID=662880 RepID=A0A7W8JZ84_9DEIO|nr:hypothetical protein [Deinococcus humi]MBB5365695.1 hypothetical protein [Deinococcus humi]GGO37156.1 hypothetical protein GCM10008949_42020 [Deinococcus humi]